MHRRLVEKYFNNETTPSESREVLKWFETSEGEQYLQERLEADAELMNRDDLRDLVPELNSSELYNSIQTNIKKKRNVFSIKRTDWLGYTVKAAAAILVVFTAYIFTISHENYLAEQVVVEEPIIFQTEDEQHREISLSDGTVVRLNENSEVIVSENFLKESREITLTGEAYFDVAHAPERPFIIHANNSSIEVLGTAFNVRAISDQANVQVAVVEGKVALKNESNIEEQHSVILTKGQFGYLDINKGEIVVEEFAIGNYLAWKSGRFNFEKNTLHQVCVQLDRLYNLDCNFSDLELSNLHLTANFSNESPDKTLSVIALTLNLDYERNNNQVKWKRQ